MEDLCHSEDQKTPDLTRNNKKGTTCNSAFFFSTCFKSLFHYYINQTSFERNSLEIETTGLIQENWRKVHNFYLT